MQTFKKICKWIGWATIALILFVYLVLAVLLKFGELKANEDAKNRSLKAEPIYTHTKEPQKVTLLNHGLASFYARLNLIEQAKKSIELEFFIYDLDASSRILTRALAKKAKEGIKVRLLVDFSTPVFKLQPAYANYLKQNGVDVRYYNTVGMHMIYSTQHRSHRKLLVVDDAVAITGGRNIANDYFEVSDHYNFWDSDVSIEGSIAKSIRESFDLYWRSDLATDPAAEGGINFLEKEKDDELYLQLANTIGQQKLKSEFTSVCTDSVFVTDFPAAGETNRRVYRALLEELSKAQTSVVAESPYFVVKEGGVAPMRELRARNLKVKILTNSLYSTDAFYTVAALVPTLLKLSTLKFDMHVFDGSSRQPPSHPKAATRWGVHAKRAVIDNHTILVGTYNVDPRSANLNSEMLYICRGNTELAEAQLQDFENRFAMSRPLIDQNGKIHWYALVKDASWQSLSAFVFSLPLASMFDFLL